MVGDNTRRLIKDQTEVMEAFSEWHILLIYGIIHHQVGVRLQDPSPGRLRNLPILSSHPL